MQARIAQIIEKLKRMLCLLHKQTIVSSSNCTAYSYTSTAITDDHTIALRQEVAAMNQQVAAMGQVVDAVGRWQLYAMFQQQTQPTSYSAAFQAGQHEQVEDGDYW